MKLIKTVLITILLCLIICLAGCTTDTSQDIIVSLDRMYNLPAKRIDLASSFKVDLSRIETDNIVFNAWFDILPSHIEFDTGISISHNQTEVYITGQIGTLGELAKALLQYQSRSDLDIELYINANQGVFFKSKKAFNITKQLLPQWQPNFSKEGWLEIGSQDDAQKILNLIKDISDNVGNDLEQYIEFGDTRKENESYTTNAKINMLHIQNTIKQLNSSNSTWLNWLSDFFAITSWQATYSLNNNSELVETSFTPTLNEVDSALLTTSINKLIKDIEGVILRFYYEIPPETPLFDGKMQ